MTAFWIGSGLWLWLYLTIPARWSFHLLLLGWLCKKNNDEMLSNSATKFPCCDPNVASPFSNPFLAYCSFLKFAVFVNKPAFSKAEDAGLGGICPSYWVGKAPIIGRECLDGRWYDWLVVESMNDDLHFAVVQQLVFKLAIKRVMTGERLLTAKTNSGRCSRHVDTNRRCKVL